MNPVFDRDLYIPDPEAHVWPDGRLYIYGSRDEGGNPRYCSPIHNVLSTDNLVNWVDHGISFDSKDCGLYDRPTLSAPDAAYKDGKYYLHFCINKQGGRECVAVSDTPEGPFTDPSPIEGADFGGIDPAVLVDDDGEAYLYWGQFNMKAARLNPDMRSIDMETYNPALLSEKEHGFHEGSCIRKVDGRYYLVYVDISRGLATCLSYAVSDHPLGPYEKKGVIIDNTHCDPSSWNNHGSIEQFNGRWYVFYHRSSQNLRTSRRACIEPIEILEDGTIPEVEMTTQGVEGPIPATIKMEAWRSCLLYGTVHTAMDGETEYLQFKTVNDFAAFKYLQFSAEKKVTLRARGAGKIQIALGQSWDPAIAEFELDANEVWKEIEMPLLADTPAEPKAAYLVLLEGTVDVASFQFS